VFFSESRDHRAFASLGMITLGIALLCDIFCLPALVKVFDKPPKPPGGPPPARLTEPAA
jgi:hypothetical protein